MLKLLIPNAVENLLTTHNRRHMMYDLDVYGEITSIVENVMQLFAVPLFAKMCIMVYVPNEVEFITVFTLKNKLTMISLFRY